MREAGIMNAESQDGIDFCVDHCPYDHCVIAEPMVTIRQTVNAEVRRMFKAGKSVQVIMEILNMSERTVRRIIAK